MSHLQKKNDGGPIIKHKISPFAQASTKKNMT